MIKYLLRGRPAVLAALALAFGVAISSLFSYTASQWFVVVFLLLSPVGYFLTRQAPLIRLVLFVISVALLGELVASLDLSNYRNTQIGRIASMKISKAVVTGTLDEAEDTKSSFVWVFETDSIGLLNERSVYAKGRILLRLPKTRQEKVPLPAPGSRLRVFCSLEPILGPTNPHEFAADRRWQTQTHTEAEGHLHSRFDYVVISPPKPNLISSIRTWRDGAHASILGLIDTAIIDTDARGFVEAVVLGDRSDMDKETLNDFTVSGVAHILAVSGFNVAIVSLVVAQLLRLLGIYWHRTRIGFTMLMVFLYSAIVGFEPSVVRALLMIELYLLALLLERKPDPLNIVASAALVELLIRPYDLFDVSFQLSYAAVLGLVLLAPRIRWLVGLTGDSLEAERPFQKIICGSKSFRKLLEAFALSLGASLASYPIIAAHFYRMSFVGLAANLPLIPLSAVITALGFLLIPLAAVSTWLGQVYGEATTYLSKGLLLITKFAAHVPLAARAVAEPSWVALVLFAAAMVFCWHAKTRKIFFGRVLLSSLCALLLTSVGIPFTNSLLEQNEGKLQVLFFDVGQGDAILIYTPSGKSYLVDFGTINRLGNSRAEQTIIPFLRAENRMTVEAGFISHMHIDHYGGAPSVLENCNVLSLMTSGERVNSPIARSLDSLAALQHTTLRVLSRGDAIMLDTGLTLYVIHPDRHEPLSQRTVFGENIHSGMLAFKLVYRKTSFLFLGDVERSEEEQMLADYGGFLHSNVVKVAHHGSLTSSSKDFVAATNPNFAVISVGEHNLFGHPAPAIVKRWMNNGSQVFRTDLDGAVLFVSDGNTVKHMEWR
jgi:competence protein ComEC